MKTTRAFGASGVALPALVLLAAALLSAGCGKKGPPQPPLKRGPDRPASVGARQEGSSVVITGLLPERSQDGGPLTPIVELRVLRLDRGITGSVFGSSGRSAQRTAVRQFGKEAQRIATLSGPDLARALSGRRFAFRDVAPVSAELLARGKDLTYAVVVVDAEKRASPLSLFAPIRVRPPLLPPSNVQAETPEGKIVLRWEPPAPQAEGEARQYNVYRSEEGGEPGRPRNVQPLAQPLFEDSDFEYGKSYQYRVRSVTVTQGTIRESADSVPLTVTPADVYPPAPPTGLAVSADAGVIKLYWFPNAEPDLGGYRIYRSGSETEGFEVIDRTGPSETSYIDRTARPGVKYYYCLTAEDRARPPNESARSEVHGDRIPAAGPPAPGAKRP